MFKKEEFLEMFVEVLELDGHGISIDTNLETIEEYDSLGALSVFTAISEKTDGKSDEIDFTEADSIGDIFDALKKAGLAS